MKSPEGVRRILWTQLWLAIATAGAFTFQNGPAALAALYGGVVALGSSALLARSVNRAGALAVANPGRAGIALYGGLIQRFVFAAVLLAAGIAFYRRGALAALAGYAITHLGFLASAIGAGAEKKTTSDSAPQGPTQ
jgi:F0F1-type ATP synthase assembly protein I